MEDRSLLSVSVWNGSVDNNWATQGNWDAAPQPGDQLVFPSGAARTNTYNNFPAGASFQSIELDDDFTLSGNNLAVTDQISDAGTSTIALNVALAGAVAIHLGQAPLTISGNLSGSNYLTKDGPGTLILSGANSYSGGTMIYDGTLQVGNDAALVQCGNGLLVNGDGAVLDLNGHSVTVGQVGLVDGAITNTASTSASITATSYVVLSGTIAVDLYGSDAPMLKGTDGSVTPAGANYHTGPTTAYAGQLTLAGADAWNPIFSDGGALVGDGTLVLDYSANPSADPVADVRGATNSGLIRSSVASSSDTVGYDDNNVTGRGVAGAVVLQRAVVGDANLDGVVNGSDLTLLTRHWLQTTNKWTDGDFNHDGVVNGSDLTLLTRNWLQSPSPSPPQVSVLARLGATDVSSNSEQFVVAFSRDVTGVGTDDFAPQLSDTTGTVTNVEALSNAVYVVTVGQVYGNGTLGLNFDSDGSVTDCTTNAPLPQDNCYFPESDQPYSVSSPFVWVGGTDSCWYTAANWQDDIQPLAGSSLLFQGTAPSGGTYDNFAQGTSFASIELASPDFDFGSQYDLTLTGGITLDAGAGDTTVSADIALGAPVTIGVADAGAALTISGSLSGSGTLTKTGPGTLTLTGSNTYSARTTVIDGTVELGPNAQPPVISGGGADQLFDTIDKLHQTVKRLQVELQRLAQYEPGVLQEGRSGGSQAPPSASRYSLEAEEQRRRSKQRRGRRKKKSPGRRPKQVKFADAQRQEKVEPTNNLAERLQRSPAKDRDAGRTNKTASGARRRSVITSVLESLRVNLSPFTLRSVVEETTRWMREGISLFKQQLQAITPPVPALENTS